MTRLCTAILAVLAILAIADNASAQLHRQYTRDTLFQHFDVLSEAGLPMRFPRLLPGAASKVGEIGELRPVYKERHEAKR